LNTVKDDIKYIIDDDGRLIDIDTGEIIDRDQIKDAYEKQLFKKYYEIHKELLALDLDTELLIIKNRGENYKCVQIKRDYTFGKVFRVAVRELMEKNKPSRNALSFIAIMEPYIYFPTNSIIYYGKSPSLKDLENIVGLKKTALYDVLNELEDKDVIKKIKRDGNIIIYFNPFLYSSGAFVLKDTYELFRKSKYNPNLFNKVLNK
jgi:hypothetical protein